MKFTNLSFKALVILGGLSAPSLGISSQGAFQEIVRKAAFNAGYKSPEEVRIRTDESLREEGKGLFNSQHLSLNARITCATCHIANKASTDGIPNAVGIHGVGEGLERFYSGAKIIPRNTLGLWGVGGVGFNTFFWDGRVDFSPEKKISQFGSKVPSADPLVTAVHLPVVEIRESIDEDDFVREQKQESVDSARNVYEAIVRNLKQHEPSLMASLANDLGLKLEDVKFLHVARAIASFIRAEFKIHESKFDSFVKGEQKLSEQELQGAMLFYGKGGCSVCHSGPYFTDLQFYTIPFPQLGFGKNGFGIDYGRYNATFDPKDLYRFRTPSLLNVERTAPYGHSGSIPDLKAAVIGHYDPLAVVELQQYDDLQRHEFYKYLAKSSTPNIVNFLTRSEVEELVTFLKTLSFEM